VAPRIFMCYVKECQPLDWRLSDFNLGEWNPDFSWLGDRLGCTAGLDSAGHVTTSCCCRNCNPGLSHCADWATLALCNIWSTMKPANGPWTQHSFWDVKRQEYVSATRGSHDQDVHRQWKGNIYSTVLYCVVL